MPSYDQTTDHPYSSYTAARLRHLSLVEGALHTHSGNSVGAACPTSPCAGADAAEINVFRRQHAFSGSSMRKQASQAPVSLFLRVTSSMVASGFSDYSS